MSSAVDLPTLLPSALLPGRRPRTVRDWLVDLLCVLLALGYGALIVRVGDASVPDAVLPWRVDVAIGVVGCAALWFRRDHPLAVALGIVALTSVSMMATGAMVIAVFGVAVHRKAATALLAGAASLATVPLYVLPQAHPKYTIWVDLGFRLMVTGGAIGWGMFARARRQLVASLRERAARVEAEQQLRIEQARLTERTRIAREMHDVLAHRMSLVSLYAGVLSVRTDAPPAEVAAAAGVIRANAHEALQELRAVIGVLRAEAPGDPERPQPGLPDIAGLVEEARATGMRVRHTGPPADGGPPVVTGRTAFRIVQEGLTNARKHAPGTTVEVLVDGRAGDGLRVRVSNPHPLPAAHTDVPGAGLGLVGLTERVALAGGRLRYGPAADGFAVEAWLPW